MKKINVHDEIFLIENFLSEEECFEYLLKYQTVEFEEAKISVDGNQVMNKGVRNNDRYLFFDEDLGKDFWNRLQDFIPKKVGFYEGIGLNEMFRVYKYTKGQRFKMHIDGSYRRNLEEQSFYSFLIYLNDDFEGGETVFRNIGTGKPKKGTALVFRHRLRHEGKELISGVKYVLRTDVMYRRV